MRSSLVVGLALSFVVASGVALAQTSLRPRVILMVDTSGSMTFHFTDNNSTGGDGSTVYTDALLTRGLTQSPGFGLYTGYLLSGTCSSASTSLSAYDGPNSRLYAAKAAVTNLINGAGTIDFGLMRFSGTTCPVVNTSSVTATSCTGTNDAACPSGYFCRGGKCATDDNLCLLSAYYDQACNVTTQAPANYAGDCGTASASGSAACATPQVCYADTDCSGAKVGQCAAIAGSSAKSCQCGGTYAACPVGWTCTSGRCAYNVACQSPGGTLVVDPASSGSNAQILPWVDGVEALPGNLLGLATNPELRASGNTPLAGAARSAATWYSAIKNGNFDPYIACRPYVLVELTDGLDSCETDVTNGPVAAAGSFVAATVAGAKTLNKVYVIGLTSTNPALDAIAKAGGTASARLANSQQDIQAALADIVASSQLIEKCNNADDDCNSVCDEPFPDVAITGAACSNKRSAKTCNNGQPLGTHCYATGVYVCSTDQLSETCSAQTCSTNAALCPTAESAGACNGIDDDCNGVIDDCTPSVGNSCCTSACPACNPTGTPLPETCNGCDDDCNGVVDDHLVDTGKSCGSSFGLCEPGTTYCCQETNPSTTSCTRSQVSPSTSNPDKLVCLGGRGPTIETCDGTDNNCNGVVDDLAQTCYPFATGTPGVGTCRAGTAKCTATACGTSPSACCPALTPPIANGKPCPGSSSYGACTGAVGPAAETCNGLDDNCNGTVDDALTDAWIATTCCSTGALADCANTGGSTRCKQGTSACVSGARACVGAVARTQEICNGVDDDCNGTADDVAGAGAACTGAGLVTIGACKATYSCVGGAPGPGPNGLTCTQLVGPQPEICNGLDDDCNGTVDNAPTDVGGACATLCPGGVLAGCVGRCKAGVFSCANGAKVCSGAIGPAAEVCNGIDDDCNGATDDSVTDAWALQGCCSTGNVADCQNGTTSTHCKPGALACVSGAQACVGSVARAAETCDGIDDDCNGIIDDVSGVGTACTAAGVLGAGACKAAWTCGGAPGPGPGGLTCTQLVGPSAEVCDGLDNDCNGQIDDAPADVGGACATLCPGGLVANCVGQCKAGTTACVNGAKICAGAVGPSPEVCDGGDNDCNGSIDDAVAGAGQACGSGVGACTPGALQCMGGVLACTGGVLPAPEVCNGQDDNCNGVTDEGVAVGDACAPAYDAVAYPGARTSGACHAGATVCNGVAGLGCSGAVGPSPEVCDGIDNDCDGVVDETGAAPDGIDATTSPTGSPSGAIGDACGSSTGSCQPGHLDCVAGAVECLGATGPAPESCDCVDNDCDGVVDNPSGGGIPLCGAGESCVKGAGVCACALPCGTGTACPGGQTCQPVISSQTGQAVGNFCFPGGSTPPDAGADAQQDAASDAADGATVEAGPDAAEGGSDAALVDAEDGSTSEAGVDAAGEASADAASEAGVDAAGEASADAASEASVDAASEASVDAASEASVDAGGDGATDGAAGEDAAAEAGGGGGGGGEQDASDAAVTDTDAASGDQGGCGCRVGGRAGTRGGLVALALLGVAAARAKRRRRSSVAGEEVSS